MAVKATIQSDVLVTTFEELGSIRFSNIKSNAADSELLTLGQALNSLQHSTAETFVREQRSILKAE